MNVSQVSGLAWSLDGTVKKKTKQEGDNTINFE